MIESSEYTINTKDIFMSYYALIYHLADEYLERRGVFRSEHLGLAEVYHKVGKLLLAGAFSEPFDRALLIFQVDSPKEIEAFIAQDPYVANGLILRWEIRPWNVVIGNK